MRIIRKMQMKSTILLKLGHLICSLRSILKDLPKPHIKVKYSDLYIMHDNILMLRRKLPYDRLKIHVTDLGFRSILVQRICERIKDLILIRLLKSNKYINFIKLLNEISFIYNPLRYPIHNKPQKIFPYKESNQENLLVFH